LRIGKAVISRYQRFYLYLRMSAAQIKSEIQKVLNHIPESVLGEVLSFLRGLQPEAPSVTPKPDNESRQFEEQRDLLEKLALHF
jgi:hypothetical protein